MANSPENSEAADMNQVTLRIADCLEKLRKIDYSSASDEDLKLSDTYRYYMRDTSSAKELLNRRLRCLANYETANRNLEKARAKNKDVQQAQNAQVEACEKYESISKLAKQGLFFFVPFSNCFLFLHGFSFTELTDFKARRVIHFKKHLVELAELQIKHAKVCFFYLLNLN